MDARSAAARADGSDVRNHEQRAISLQLEPDPHAGLDAGQDLRRADGELHGHRRHEAGDVVVADGHVTRWIVHGHDIALARVRVGTAAGEDEDE